MAILELPLPPHVQDETPLPLSPAALASTLSVRLRNAANEFRNLDPTTTTGTRFWDLYDECGRMVVDARQADLFQEAPPELTDLIDWFISSYPDGDAPERFGMLFAELNGSLAKTFPSNLNGLIPIRVFASSGLLSRIIPGHSELSWRDKCAESCDWLAEILSSDQHHSTNIKELTILYHGERCYSINGGDPLTVPHDAHKVLQAFLKNKTAMETHDLEKQSRCSNASRTLKDLVLFNDGIFSRAIRRAAKKGRGGHFIRVSSATDRD